ncbi:helix-turn-helix transcriptional regulator [Methylorubrum salsuginis]|uniref:WYL domain-containing protein n=1 Tax=Methylorubrum salsuginis TaxID=414703 RepID=A0A1I4A2N0_9HYPH|nr:YafY family protein [Methylorubrum salsuginis]SFK50500.1 WYL domain-containing protein [Methylorubrum salsuginis]
MARTDRLFRLLHAMRVLPAPVTAARLAEETGVSLRSLYRDIDALRAAGARIEGERGYGYRLIEDVALPPQTFERIEIEALVLGLSEVRQMGDPALAQAAASVLAKVAATLPDRAEQHLLHAASRVRRFQARFPTMPGMETLMETIRGGCWREEALALHYSDKDGTLSERTILPLSIVYLDSKMTLLAWCGLRSAYRMFRIDRIRAAAATGTSFRPRRATLLRGYLAELEAECAPSLASPQDVPT